MTAICPSTDVGSTRAGRFPQRGELALALGIALLVTAAALSQFVMIGLLSFITTPLALIVWLTGTIGARNTAASAGRQAAGMILLLAAGLALGAAAFVSVAAAGAAALHAQSPGAPAPSLRIWTLTVGSWVIPLLLMELGLRLGTDWSARRRWTWGGIILIVPAAAMALFWLLAGTLPITA